MPIKHPTSTFHFKKCLNNCQNKSNSSHLSELSNRGYITSYPKIFENTKYTIHFAYCSTNAWKANSIQFSSINNRISGFLSQYVLNQTRIFPRANNYDLLYSLSQTSGRTVSKTHILPNWDTVRWGNCSEHMDYFSKAKL